LNDFFRKIRQKTRESRAIKRWDGAIRGTDGRRVSKKWSLRRWRRMMKTSGRREEEVLARKRKR